jgi:lipopolysaccharide export system permease protein
MVFFTKIDKLVSKAFLTPFLMTYAIVLFILLLVFFQKYLEDLVGKDLGLDVYGRLLFYFALNQTSLALPIAVLLSSLMSFGNLGEHNEITAVKSAGISLIRILLPVAAYAVLIAFAAYFFNDLIVPDANLKAYRLMYDVRQKKPSLDLKEGGFYNGISNYSIRVEKKSKTSNELYGMMIYDHTNARGNTDLIMADTGKMYFINNDRYLVLELGRGTSFSEYNSYNAAKREFKRDNFEAAKFVFSLENLALGETPEELFRTNRVMRNVEQLSVDVDSLHRESKMAETQISGLSHSYFDYQFQSQAFEPKADVRDSIPPDYQKFKPNPTDADWEIVMERAFNKANNIKSFATGQRQRVGDIEKNARLFAVELHRKFALSVACFMMFLIGAPLGAIIKKGGLGVPILVSIIFFLLFYFMTITGEKYAREGVVGIVVGSWMANVILFFCGLLFLTQARSDSRLFDADAYWVFFQKIKDQFKKLKKGKIAAS